MDRNVSKTRIGNGGTVNDCICVESIRHYDL